ncbi:FecR domain-containing protein [Oxalobacteraceae bacterium OTU3CINTB1]|nr:FecR domain-containing protein [Oxalobacteraceae bacterium OTU3CINTB1]
MKLGLRPAPPDRAAISKQILTEAATWLMELHDGPLSHQERAQLDAWRQRSAEHELAWEKATALMGKFGALPPSGATALKTMSMRERRGAVKLVAALLVAGPIGWMAYRNAPWPDAGGFRTSTGGRRDIVLDDGTRITLNTDTHIDVAYDRARRMVHLRRGEILITTARDAARPPRPFLVDVGEGAIRALGTRFVVRQLEQRSQVSVFEGAVELRPRDAPAAAAVIAAGRQSVFSRARVEPSSEADEAAIAWQHGMLIADRMPLARFVAELNRYRPGTLRCAPAVAGLAVSGAFSLTDTDLTLSLLEQTQPVKLRYVTRFWATVGPA